MGVSFVSYFQVFTIIQVQHTLIETLGGKVVCETPLPEPRPPQKWELHALGTTPLMLHNFIEYINITSHTNSNPTPLEETLIHLSSTIQNFRKPVSLITLKCINHH